MALTGRAEVFRQAMAEFIANRAAEKLKDKTDAAAADKYDYATWLISESEKIKQVQLATFPIKATHSDVKIDHANSLFIQGYELPSRSEIGTHLITKKIWDATGNAAALGAFKFLMDVVVEEKPLIHWVFNDDQDLISAFHDEQDIAEKIHTSFKKILRENQSPASHFLAKQLYWLVGDEPDNDSHYHLLQPLFSSSLAHAVYEDIVDEDNKLAREAFKNKSEYDQPYREYKGLAVRKLGGTKPQNISQLNSECNGENYLLASLPPLWNSKQQVRVHNVESAFTSFTYFDDVFALIKELAEFLKTHDHSIMAIRQQREALVQALAQQLALFGLTVSGNNEPGWTRDNACKLPLCEQLWLDPERVELPNRLDHQDEDEAFKAAYTFGDWADDVASRFGAWLNERLRELGVQALGDVEHRHFARQAIMDVDWPIPLQRRATGGVV